MKELFQRRIQLILEQGDYRVDTEQGCVYSYRKNEDSWQRLKGVLHHGKFRQLVLFFQTNDLLGNPISKPITVYEHYVVYVAAYGLFDPKMKVAWKDGDRNNNKAWNLYLVPRKDPNSKCNKVRKGRTLKEFHEIVRKFTDEDLKKIKEMLDAGETNKTRIAEAIQRPVQTTRYHINKILNPKKSITPEVKKSIRRDHLKSFLKESREERMVTKIIKKDGFDPRIDPNQQEHFL